jgi:hypothetical protein
VTSITASDYSGALQCYILRTLDKPHTSHLK